MEAPHERINRLADAGVVSIGRSGKKTVSSFEHVSGRVRFGPWVDDGGAARAAGYARVLVDGVPVPATYVLGAPAGSSASIEAGYEHFLALCSSLGLLGSEFEHLAVEPNAATDRGRIERWSGRRALGFALRHRSVEDEGGDALSTAGCAYTCAGYDTFPVDNLIGDGLFESRADGARWLGQEIRDAFADDEDVRGYGYVNLMGQPVMTPVVLFRCADGGITIWDGWHRVAASLCRGAKVIRAVVVDGMGS